MRRAPRRSAASGFLRQVRLGRSSSQRVCSQPNHASPISFVPGRPDSRSPLTHEPQAGNSLLAWALQSSGKLMYRFVSRLGGRADAELSRLASKPLDTHSLGRESPLLTPGAGNLSFTPPT